MALLVYDGSEGFGHQFKNIMPIRIDNEYAVVASNHMLTVIAFAGTDDWGDVVDDADFISEKHDGFGKVHGGFMGSYQKVSGLITQYLREVHYAGTPIMCVGHSKGGAMAQICALDLWNKGLRDVSKIVTFGSPRVGKGEFARRSKVFKHDRYVNGKDPVPRVPRAYMGFKHTGKRIHFTDGWWTWGWVGDFSDHSMVRYQEQYNAKAV
jgi:triacylglycerol lipase